ncbi:MAG: protease modulator HflC [Fibrobacteria bacterium]|nr:protease modulator HflC [Fibrobacteria bacterium]
MKKVLIALLALIVLPFILYFFDIIYIVDETEYAVKTRLGKVSSVLKNEPNRIGYSIPLVHELKRYPAKLQSHDASPEHIVTLDKKKLIVDNYFKWKIDDVVLFRNAVGNVTRANNRLVSIVHDAVKDVLGNTLLSAVISEGQEIVLEKSLAIADSASRPIGVTITDIRFKKVQLPKSNELRLYERMKSERYQEAASYRSKGKEESIRIISETDRAVRVIGANAYKTAQEIRGEADALAAQVYAEAFSKDPEFYSFWRTLETYRKTLDTATTLVISPKSELYKYLAGN